MCVCVLRDSVPLWPREPCQAFLSMGFSQQENGGCYFLLQVIFPTQGSKPMSPALAGGFFTTEPSGNHKHVYKYENIHKYTYTWRRKWQPTPVFSPRESHGQRSLAGYSPWDCKSRTRLSD